jgi:serine/threonine protein kinase/tetratricopeptide (TPR) repeat protein
MPLAAGDRLGHYEVISLIGSGGMGEVYRARDPRLGRDVAVKTLRSAGADGRARLWREARAAASVSHPSVCQIHDVGETSDNIYIVMELLQGEPLAHRLKDGPLPVDDAIKVTLSILGALTALHSRDIVHRDLKPSNVFLTDSGIKLLDFGLARSRHPMSGAELTITQAGTIVGTPRYMAPEQWGDSPPDPRSDVFTTGSLMFEMLTGTPAFAGNDLVQVYHNIMSSHPPPLAGSAVTAAVDVVIHRALEKRLDDRYPTAEAMAQALRAAVTLANTGTHTQTAVRPTTRLIALPFRMLRPDSDLDFLSFSLPDAVVSSLAGLQSLVVRSTLAGARYAAADTIDLKAIAADLGVDVVLTGTLLRAGDQVRVSAQLIEAATGTMLWSKTVQATMRDLFEVQDQLARAIVDSLSIPLSSGEKQRLTNDLPASARAYEFYLRGNQIGHDHTMLPVAGELYRSALDEDPQYAPAWAKLGRVYRVLAKYGGPDATENFQRANDAFQRALELNPDLSIAHNLYTNFEVESLGRAKEAMARLLARAGSHSDPEIFTGLVIACRFCGLLDGSLAADRQARRLDPAVRTSVMYTHFMRGDWERALASDTDHLRWVTNWTLPLLGRHQEAIAAYREIEAKPLPGLTRDLMRASRCVLEGKRDEALKVVQSFIEKHFDPEGLYFVARVLAQLDDHDAALDMLHRIIDRGFYCSAVMLHDPWLDPIRGRSRFNEIVGYADARSREAQSEFLGLNGERILALNA